MAAPSITVENLGKRYRIGRRSETRLTDALAGSIRAQVASRLRGQRASDEIIWALRHVSFDVGRGEVLGVIGRNGAGKSTLLKLLSRITAPTEGRATLRGHVGALLEVGTGFHPELTGRENVYLSAAILGMPRTEIDRRFDEIVDFAGVEAFIDTPVKRYSSGMQVRLGFAVAAHLDSDVLFVDEVLAVGDARFQAKCLGRLEEVGNSGRTVIFVSHNLQAVLRLCSRALLLDGGRLAMDGRTTDVVRAYLESDLGRTSERVWRDPANAPGDRVARLKSIRIVSASGAPADEIDIRQAFDVQVEYSSEDPGDLRPSANLHFFNEQGICLFATADHSDRAWSEAARTRGFVRAVCHVPGNFLAEGQITITVAISTFNPLIVHAVEPEAVAIQIVDRSTGDGVRGDYVNEWPGVVRPLLDWHVTDVVHTPSTESQAG